MEETKGIMRFEAQGQLQTISDRLLKPQLLYFKTSLSLDHSNSCDSYELLQD